MENVEERMIAHLDALTKPKGSLGKLEDYCVKLAAVQGRVPPRIGRKRVYVFAGDHGIVAEGVSLYPQEVTAQMVLNFLSGGAAINALAGANGWEVAAVDSGVAADFELPPEEERRARFIDRKIGRGSANFLRGPAMTAAELGSCLEAGAGLAEEAARDGCSMVAVGDMGIGNTTTAAALLVACGFEVDRVVDRGTGIDDAALERKRAIVARAARDRGPFTGPEDILAKLGGFDLAMMAGFVLGLRGRGIACVLDGFPVSAAAYMAWRIDPSVASFLFAGHLSRVSGHAPVLRAMGLDPVVALDMRLGEGTGAVIGGRIIELAAIAASEMASFAQAGVSGGSGDEKDY